MTGEQDATLTVVDQSLAGTKCTYTVTAALPAGFAAGDGTARNTANSRRRKWIRTYEWRGWPRHH